MTVSSYYKAKSYRKAGLVTWRKSQRSEIGPNSPCNPDFYHQIGQVIIKLCSQASERISDTLWDRHIQATYAICLVFLYLWASLETAQLYSFLRILGKCIWAIAEEVKQPSLLTILIIFFLIVCRHLRFLFTLSKSRHRDNTKSITWLHTQSAFTDICKLPMLFVCSFNSQLRNITIKQNEIVHS